VHVEVAGLLAFGVNEHSSHTDLVTRSGRSLKRVFDEGLPKTVPLLGDIHPEPSQEDNGNPMAAGPSLNTCRRGFPLYRSSRQGVISDDPPRFHLADDEDAASPGLVGLKSVLT